MDINICRICGNPKNNQSFFIKEKMFRTNDEFEYYECSECGCLQIKQFPASTKEYYPSNYYSYAHTQNSEPFLHLLKNNVKKACIYCRINNTGFVGKIASSFYNDYPWIIKNTLNFNSSILDVGCGDGNQLLWMHKLGFKKLKGIDPYIESDINYPMGVSIQKKFIQEESGLYDFIMLHHSFEHMDNPLETLEHLYKLLNHNSYILIRVPVSQSYAWRKYKTDWVQLDAPRHLFIHTTKSISVLADKVGLELTKVLYDSTMFQFTGSEKNLRNIPFDQKDSTVFTSKEIKHFSKAAVKLNDLKDGDTACFYLYKK